MGEVKQVVSKLVTIVLNQKTLATTKLCVLVQELSDAAAIEEQERNKLRAEVARLKEAARKHKVAMQDYENLKAKNKRLKTEYNILVESRLKKAKS